MPSVIPNSRRVPLKFVRLDAPAVVDECDAALAPLLEAEVGAGRRAKREAGNAAGPFKDEGDAHSRSTA